MNRCQSRHALEKGTGLGTFVDEWGPTRLRHWWNPFHTYLGRGHRAKEILAARFVGEQWLSGGQRSLSVVFYAV
jgi:hypothetical protein